MGHRPTASEEVQQLRQATREAHEAAQELRAAIREAKALEPGLVAQFEAVHQREIQQLSNYFNEESNRHAAQLNADVERAKDMIMNDIMSGELVLNADKNEVRLRLGGHRFDEHQPPPYPRVTKKEGHQ